MAKKEKTQLQKDLQVQKCVQEIAKVLKKYGCEMEPIGTLRNNSIELGLNVFVKK